MPSEPEAYCHSVMRMQEANNLSSAAGEVRRTDNLPLMVYLLRALSFQLIQVMRRALLAPCATGAVGAHPPVYDLKVGQVLRWLDVGSIVVLMVIVLGPG